jgi:hypothetical protein
MLVELSPVGDDTAALSQDMVDLRSEIEMRFARLDQAFSSLGSMQLDLRYDVVNDAAPAGFDRSPTNFCSQRPIDTPGRSTHHPAKVARFPIKE